MHTNRNDKKLSKLLNFFFNKLKTFFFLQFTNLIIEGASRAA